MKQIHLYGNTFAVKDSIKKDGFKFDKNHKRWSKDVDDDLFERCAKKDTSAIVEIKGNKKGCCVVAFTPDKYILCWESKTFLKNNAFFKTLPAGYTFGFDEI